MHQYEFLGRFFISKDFPDFFEKDMEDKILHYNKISQGSLLNPKKIINFEIINPRLFKIVLECQNELKTPGKALRLLGQYVLNDEKYQEYILQKKVFTYLNKREDIEEALNKNNPDQNYVTDNSLLISLMFHYKNGTSDPNQIKALKEIKKIAIEHNLILTKDELLNFIKI